MSGPLDGFRVIELATMVSAPIATMLLADQGAEVIKVEAPPHGDIMRRLGPQRGGVTAGFATINRGKRSLALDLKQERGIGILHDLVATADVFVQNFRPGVVNRLGLGVDRLRELNPRLVYVSISGFGQEGPYAQKRVYDPIIQALSGFADIQADRLTGEPKMVRTIVPDKVTGLTAAQAITAALLARERTGEGQHLELAMLDATISFIWPEGFVRQILVGGEVAHGRPGSTSDLIYRTADGYITASTISDAEWEGMARATGHLEWLEDERYNTAAGRISNADQRLGMVGDVMRTRTSAEWIAALEAEDVPCAKILTRNEVLTDPQVVRNELLRELDHPQVGRMRLPRAAAKFSATPPEPAAASPVLGEGADDLLAGLGMSAAEIDTLRREKIVG